MDLNESSLIEREITLRNLRLPKEVMETRRSMIRWLALSLGIVNPGESRLGALAVLDALIHFQFIKKYDPKAGEISEYIGKNWAAINDKTLRYHLLRMKRMGFIENAKGRFYLKLPKNGERYDPASWPSAIFQDDYGEMQSKIKSVILGIKSRSQ
jgi:hypothetical protein